jgi:hypothetical protein
MADRLNLYLQKSIAKWLEDNLTIDNAVLVGPNFNWDAKPDVTDARKTVPRPLPFAGIATQSDEERPFTMSKNILSERDITVSVFICATNLTNLYNLTSDMRQTLRSASHPITGKIGVPLYDYAVVSGNYYNSPNTVDISEVSSPFYTGRNSTSEQGNRSYMSETLITFTAFKDATATLLENKGRIGINE